MEDSLKNMSDTRLHDFCKGFGALLSRSKVSDFPFGGGFIEDTLWVTIHSSITISQGSTGLAKLVDAVEAIHFCDFGLADGQEKERVVDRTAHFLSFVTS